MIIEFNVNNQKMQTLNKIFLADKSHNILQCKFNITGEDWKNKQIFALLRNNKCDTYQLHLNTDNTIRIPSEILEEEKFTISLYAEDQDENRITTNTVNFRLAPSGYTTDIKDLEDVDENIWVQIFESIDSKSDVDHTHIVEDITDFPSLSEVAYSGEYTDLNGKPSIPSKISDLTDDSDFVKSDELEDTVNIINNQLNGKVDKITGKQLSSNDYTDNEKNKLSGIEAGANKVTKTSELSNDAGFLTEHQDISMKADKTYVDNEVIDIKEYVDETIGNLEGDMLQ